ncbi:50S ribosomal protein L25 [Candidatus Peribacteria bacterium]|nr:50S ribosomal protein L25 [Candidatus Peribacteria bacterium]
MVRDAQLRLSSSPRHLDQAPNPVYSIPAMNKEVIALAVSARDKGVSPKNLRRVGTVPGVIYGGKAENTSIQCSMKELHNVYVKAGENTLVEIDLGGKKIPCLIHAISFDPVSDKEEHVDFYAVDMTKKVTTHVPVRVEGESPAVKTLGGVLVTVHDEIEVTCLPSDIPAFFMINIAKLDNFRDSITVASLTVPKDVVIKSPADMVILTVQEPRAEEVVEVVAAPVEGAVAADGTAVPAAEGAPGSAPAATAPAGKTDDKGAGKDKAAKK